VSEWLVIFSKRAQKDARLLDAAGLKARVDELIEVLREDPFRSPPRFEKLRGELEGALSRRINLQHRLVYIVLSEEREVRVLRMWSHYE
jgi:Txe/YoeB family toxin of toxin-antitoxin system